MFDDVGDGNQRRDRVPTSESGDGHDDAAGRQTTETTIRPISVRRTSSPMTPQRSTTRRRRRPRGPMDDSTAAPSSSSPPSALLLSYLLSLILVLSPSFAKVAAAAPPSRPGGVDAFDALEERRFGPLPPTVFAPSGRLHMVERVATEASDASDRSAPLAVAIRCVPPTTGHDRDATSEDGDGGVEGEDKGGSMGDTGGNGFIVLACTGPVSPHGYSFHRPPAGTDANNATATASATEETAGSNEREGQGRNSSREGSETDSSSPANGNFSAPLLLVQQGVVSPPLSVMGPSLAVATGGGNAAESAVLLRRVQEAAVGLRAESSGGGAGGDGLGTLFGFASVRSGTLARRVADAAQVSTQTVGGKGGRMLASSALIIGADDAPPIRSTSHGRGPPFVVGGRRRRIPNVWRVDPTGQFWNCDAAAVGRGAGTAEAFLMRRVAAWKMKGGVGMVETVGNGEDADADAEGEKGVGRGKRGEHEGDVDDLEDALSLLDNDDVRSYLGRLTVRDALALARECLLETLAGDGGGGRGRRTDHSSDDRDGGGRRDWGQIQAVVLDAGDGGVRPPSLRVMNERGLDEAISASPDGAQNARVV